MKLKIISIIIIFFLPCLINANDIKIEQLLEKAYQGTVLYQETFKNLVGEELRTYESYEKNGNLSETRTIKSNFVVYQSAFDNRVLEYRNVTEFNGKVVARQDGVIVNFFETLTQAESKREEIERLKKESNRFEGKLRLYGFTLSQGFVLNPIFRPCFDYQIVGTENVEGHQVTILEYRQIKPTTLIKVNQTNEERKQEPRGIKFDLPYLPSNFRPTNPSIQGKLWLDAETAQLWRNDFKVSIQPNFLSNPVVGYEARFEYKPSQFNILLPNLIWLSNYRLAGNTQDKLTKTRAFSATFQYSEFRKTETEANESKNS